AALYAWAEGELSKSETVPRSGTSKVMPTGQLSESSRRMAMFPDGARIARRGRSAPPHLDAARAGHRDLAPPCSALLRPRRSDHLAPLVKEIRRVAAALRAADLLPPLVVEGPRLQLGERAAGGGERRDERERCKS